MERESTATYVGHFGMSRLLFSSGCLSRTPYRWTGRHSCRFSEGLWEKLAF